MADSQDPSTEGRESTIVKLVNAVLSPSNAFEPRNHHALGVY